MHHCLACRRPVLLLLPALAGLASAPAILAAAPPTVAVSRPVEREITEHADFLGRTEASQSVAIRARTTGYLEKVHFEAGTEVKKGDLLFQLDDRPYRVDLDRARAEVERASARLKQAEANHQRAVALARNNAISKQELDKAAAEREEAEAAHKACQAALEQARLIHDATRIVAPIDGRIGRPLVTPGNLVSDDPAKGSVLATIVALDPLHVSFDVDERSLLRITRLMSEAKPKAARLPIRVRLTGDEDFSRQGVLESIDNKVDPATGTIRVRGVLPNPERKFLPGMAAQVRLPLGGPRKALLVSDEAVFDQQGKKYVLVVNANNVVEQRAVKPGPLSNGLRVIEEGLKPEDWVVVSDRRGLYPGDRVEPRRTEMLAPRPPRKETPRSGERPALPEFPAAGPALVVTASYPGASALVVEDTVARPIDHQLNGLENMVHRFVVCSDDGAMRLTVTFKKGTDLNAAMVLVQNRIALAQPHLPDEVRRQGVSVKKRPTFLLGLALFSPDGSRDLEELGRLADRVREELARMESVADVTFLGPKEPGPQLRIELDRARLAALGLTMSAVADALREHDLQTAGGVLGSGLPLRETDRVRDVEQMGNLVIKADREGRIIRLRDVARVEQVQGWSTLSSLDGKRCAFLLVYRSGDADPVKTAKAVQARLAELAKKLPAGVEYRVIQGEP